MTSCCCFALPYFQSTNNLCILLAISISTYCALQQEELEAELDAVQSDPEEAKRVAVEALQGQQVRSSTYPATIFASFLLSALPTNSAWYPKNPLVIGLVELCRESWRKERGNLKDARMPCLAFAQERDPHPSHQPQATAQVMHLGAPA